jgi:antibiotic biosynthesis monooxygenase (ABM) superfamily enzyme
VCGLDGYESILGIEDRRDEPVTLIKNYTVSADEAEYFIEVYRENARTMSTQPGFLRSPRLSRF